jgi:hypothetical protein
MNNDATAKSKAIEALMIAYDNVPRTTTAADFDGSYDEIYRATWLQNYCEAYDWIQTQLTPTQDSTIRSKILTEIRILRNHMVDSTRYAPRPHNHRSKPAYGVATGALTFSSDPRASGWLQFALTQLNTVTKYQYSFDGIYREGGHYNLYSMVNGIPFLWHYLNVSGVDLFSYYTPAFEWPIKVRMGKGWLPSFEDSFLKPWPGHMAAKAYTTTSTSLHSSASLASVMQWSFFNTNIFTQNYTGATNDVCWDIDEYLLYDSTIPETAPNVSATVNMGGGQTIFRKNWNYADRTNRYLVFHGVAEADNHNHPDNLSFMIEAENSIMGTAPGYGPAGFSDPRRNTWYITPQANNLITVDNLAPIDSATNVTPTTWNFLDTDFFDQVEKKGFFSNGAVWNRGISFPHQNYWVVRDAVRSSATKTSRWYLHSRGTLTTNGINAKWTTISDKYGTQALFDTYSISSGGSSITSQDGWLSLFWGEEETAPYIYLVNQDTASMFLSVLYPRANGSTAPTVTNISATGLLGFTVSYADTTDIHLFKKNNTTQTASGVTTDGNYAWLSLKSFLQQSLSITNGDSLLWNGSAVFTASQPVTIAIKYQNQNTVIASSDSLIGSMNIQLKLPFLANNLTDVFLNNLPKNFIITGDSSISFSTSGSSGTINSIIGGNWSSPSTWSGGVVPIMTDNVIITVGHTVTIDLNNAICNNLNVNGKLYFRNDGTVSGLTAYGNVSVSGGGELKVNARSPAGTANSFVSHPFTIYGNLTNNGTFDMRAGSNSGGTSNGGDITFAGTTNSIITMTEYSSTNNEFNSIAVDKTSEAKIILNSDVFMSNNSTTGPAILNFINGMVETGYNTFVALSTSGGGIIGASSTKYVKGSLGRGLSTSSSANRIFEIGDENGYRPITIRSTTPAASGGYIAAKVILGNADNSSIFSSDIDKVSAVRYYQLTYNKGTGDTQTINIGKISPSYGADDGVPENNNDLRIAYSTNNRFTWSGIGPTDHTTSLATPPTIIVSDSVVPNILIANGGSFYSAIARKAGTTTNTLESGLLYGAIIGTKYFDADGDSSVVGDSVLENWVIKLYRDGILEKRTITNAGGVYNFDNLLPATYTVEESLLVNWSQTFPKIEMPGVVLTTYGENAGSLAYSVTLTAGDYIAGKDFGNKFVDTITCNDIYTLQGWNLVSVPVITTDMSKTALFPTASSQAYNYSNSYIFADTLQNGKGYWLKFPSPDTTAICGIVVKSDTIQVTAGWNMIGVFDKNISVDSIVTIPTGIISSSFFGYNNGYHQALTLEVGKSYWIKVNQSGILFFQSTLRKYDTDEMY